MQKEFYITFSKKDYFPFFSKNIYNYFLKYKKVQTFRVANCTIIVRVKEKVINVTVIAMLQF